MISDKYKECIQWDDQNIKGFFGEFKWLSNFWPCVVFYRGLEFNTSEAAYMYAKLESDEDLKNYELIRHMKPREVQQWGQKVKLRPNWDEIKLDIMREILYDKFTGNKDLKQKLISTGAKYLEESNCWRDVFYGYDINFKKGENNLGKLLMEIREKIK